MSTSRALGSVFKLNAIINVCDPRFGAKGDGVTDDSAAIQAALDALAAHSLAALTSVAGNEIVGGGTLFFPPSTAGYRLATGINVTKSKARFLGPAKIILDAGVTGFSFNYSGSSNKSWISFEHLDFIGGAIAISVGTNTVPMPMSVDRCKFVNQTTAGIKTGVSGYWNSITRSLFTSCQIGIWHTGASQDGLSVEKCAFIYNVSYDIHVEGGANVFSIEKNDFISSNAPTKTNIYIDTASAVTGSYSAIRDNKFGSEGRTGGNIIVLTGSNPIFDLEITGNKLHYLSTVAAGTGAIKIAAPLRGCKIHDNDALYGDMFDVSAANSTANNGENILGPNSIYPNAFLQKAQGNWNAITFSEPVTKYNLMDESRAYSATHPSITLSNITPTYMGATDENGVANNASTFLATAVSNEIQFNHLTGRTYHGGGGMYIGKKYTTWINCKIDVSGLVTFRANRTTTSLFSKSIYLSSTGGPNSDGWYRLVFEYYQGVVDNTFVMEIVLENGTTMTIGAFGTCEGTDGGDLFSYRVGAGDEVKQHSSGIYYSPNMPSVGYFVAGALCLNNVPGISETPGWLRLTTGTGHTLNTDWVRLPLPHTVSADKGNAASTFTPGSGNTTFVYDTPITADRAVTLSTTGAANGEKLRVVRTAAATGAFNVNVGTGPLKALAAGQWCDVEYDGSAWFLTAFGSL